MRVAIDTVHTGDCTASLKRIDSSKVDLAFADPPFNIGYEYDTYDVDDERERSVCIVGTGGHSNRCQISLACFERRLCAAIPPVRKGAGVKRTHETRETARRGS